MTDADAPTGSPQHDPRDDGTGSVPYGSRPTGGASGSSSDDTRPYERPSTDGPQQAYGRQWSPPYQQQPYGRQEHENQSYGQQPFGRPYGETPVVSGSGAYPQQQFGSFAPAPPRGLSITSFVLGLVSLVFWFSLLVPIAGLVLGFAALKREPEGRGFAIAGIVINGVFVLIAVVAIVFVILLFVGLIGTIPFLAQSGGVGLPA